MEDSVTFLGAVRNMDGEAIIKVFELYAPAIYRYGFRLSNNEWIADEIVGAVFARLLDHLAAGRGPISNVRSYLFEIAYHLVLDESRYSFQTAPIKVAASALNYENSSTVTFEERMVLEAVQRAIKINLTEDQKHVIILRFLEGFSLKETAMIMGKKVGNIKVIQNRAISALRNALDNAALGDISVLITSPAQIQPDMKGDSPARA